MGKVHTKVSILTGMVMDKIRPTEERKEIQMETEKRRKIQISII